MWASIGVGLLSGLAFLKRMPWQVWIAAGLALAAVFVYGMGYRDGSAAVQARWDRSVAETTAILNQAGVKANADAELSIPPLSPADRAADVAIPRLRPPCVVFDANDRSCAGRSH